MNRIAQFEKISFGQFLKDFMDSFEFDCTKANNIELLKTSWSNIKLPTRGTINSAGYDLITPVNFTLKPGETVKIPTGIRCKMDSNWVLTIHPRSSLGFKYQIGLANTTGIID